MNEESQARSSIEIKRVSVVCSNSGFDSRAVMVRSWFESKGIETQLVVSNWDHQRKQYKEDAYDREQVKVRKYLKNVSITRVLSYRDFCKRAIRKVIAFSPNLVYAIIPSNQLAHELNRFKNNYPNCTVVYDVCDLWPESFPSEFLLRTPVYQKWQRLRNDALINGDVVIAECQMFADKLSFQMGNDFIPVVLYARADSGINASCDLSNNEFRLCYLGSINNIIDIDEIVRVVKSLPRKVVVEVIGDGENRQTLLSALKENGIKTVYHGRVYDDQFKHEVMQRCHFGLNIMKPGVAVGLTTKSIDYLEAGLPLLNTIMGDTAAIVAERGIGVNVHEHRNIMPWDLETAASRRVEARLAYEELFSERAFYSSLNQALGRMLTLKTV